MKKTLKTEAIVEVYNRLKSAKVSKMEDAEKFAVVKAMRVFRPIADGFAAFVDDAREKLRPENFEEIQHKIQHVDTLSEEERNAVNAQVDAYARSINECILDEARKEVDLEFEPLSEEALSRLAASNDFDISTILFLGDALC